MSSEQYLMRTNCLICDGAVAIDDGAPWIDRRIHNQFFEDDAPTPTMVEVADASCTRCRAQYLAWRGYIHGDIPTVGSFADLSFRSTFATTPGSEDLPTPAMLQRIHEELQIESARVMRARAAELMHAAIMTEDAAATGVSGWERYRQRPSSAKNPEDILLTSPEISSAPVVLSHEFLEALSAPDTDECCGHWLVTVKAILIDNGRALVLRRKSVHGDCFWDLPGGRLTNHATDLIAELRRELREEIGIDCDTITPTVVCADIWRSVTRLFYRVPIAIPDNITLSDEHDASALISDEELDGDSFCGARIEPALRAVLRQELAHGRMGSS